MLKHLYIILAATFVFGFMVGVIIFFYGHTGDEGDGSIEEVSRGMTITAYSYGGCSRVGCPSYRIENNGRYSFIKRTVDGKELRYEDELSDRQLDALKEALRETDFDAVDDSEFTGTCPITYDGLAYEYAIEYRGERYEVDSCIENAGEFLLFQGLEEYFRVFEILHE